MIVSASYRTDIPAFYPDWFRARLRAGSVAWRNPYGGGLHRLALTPEAVDGFVFWTRNPEPFLPALEEVDAAGWPFVLQVTVTGYPRALEPSVPSVDRVVGVLKELAQRFGPRSLVWRYDPLLLTDLTPPAFHRAQFARLAGLLAGTLDEVVLSFAQVYVKTLRNTERAAARHGFGWSDPPAEEKHALLLELAELAHGHGLKPTLCSQPDLLGGRLEPARCIDVERLADVAGRPLAAKRKGNRPGCHCAESRDIGAYDGCLHGCVYCYAVTSPAAAKRRHAGHDPGAEAL